MSLHSIIEPTGTLLTGWRLADKDPKKADIRNKDEALEGDPAEADRTPDKRSQRQRGKVS